MILSNQTTPKKSKAVQISTPPEFRFSSLSHGKNIVLSDNGLEAYRINVNENIGTGIYVDTPLRGTFKFEAEVLDCDSSDDSLVIGVSHCPRGSHRHVDIPYNIEKTFANVCIWFGDTIFNRLNGEHLEKMYGTVNLRSIKEGDRIQLQVLTNGELSFTFNGIDQGLAAMNVYSEEYDAYVVVDFGKCTKLSITRAGQLMFVNVCMHV